MRARMSSVRPANIARSTMGCAGVKARRSFNLMAAKRSETNGSNWSLALERKRGKLSGAVARRGESDQEKVALEASSCAAPARGVLLLRLGLRLKMSIKRATLGEWLCG